MDGELGRRPVLKGLPERDTTRVWLLWLNDEVQDCCCSLLSIGERRWHELVRM